MAGFQTKKVQHLVFFGGSKVPLEGLDMISHHAEPVDRQSVGAFWKVPDQTLTTFTWKRLLTIRATLSGGKIQPELDSKRLGGGLGVGVATLR